MALKFTAVFRNVPERFIGFVEELPGANTQRRTLEEARENLQEAVELVLEASRHLAEEELRDFEVIREPFEIRAWGAATSCDTFELKAASSSARSATTRCS